jgi:hypothetical protein
MTKAEKGVERAIRLTPAADRDRWEPEWRGDLHAAQQQGATAAAEVSRGARRVAWRLRRRQVERIFTGDRGLLVAMGAWLLVIVAAVAAFLFGGPVLALVALGFMVLAVVLALAGSPNHWSHWLMVTSAVVWLACSAFFWWSFGAAVDAADAFQPQPDLVRWGGPAFVLGGVAFLGMCASVVVALVRAARR